MPHFFPVWEKWDYRLFLASELVYLSPVTFRRSPLGRGAEGHSRFAFRGNLGTQFTAGFGLPIKSSCYCRRAAHLAQQQNFNLEITGFVLDVQYVTHVDLAGWLGGLITGLNPAEVARARSQSARLEKSCRPQPFINTNRSHDFDVGTAALGCPSSAIRLHKIIGSSIRGQPRAAVPTRRTTQLTIPTLSIQDDHQAAAPAAIDKAGLALGWRDH